MDRIQINGEWYVKESTITTQPIEEEICIEATHCESLIFETDECSFNAHRIYRDDDETFYDGISIEFTDKRPPRDKWKMEYWDNENWFLGILNNNEDSLEHAREILSDKAINELKYVIKQLIERGWIKKR